MEESVTADQAHLAVLDIPEGGKYCLVESGNVTPDMIDKVIADYTAGNLSMKQLQ